jgi:hypothetical protein
MRVEPLRGREQSGSPQGEILSGAKDPFAIGARVKDNRERGSWWMRLFVAQLLTPHGCSLSIRFLALYSCCCQSVE